MGGWDLPQGGGGGSGGGGSLAVTTPLVVSGSRVYSGKNGPRYRATGYNCIVLCPALGTSKNLNATQLDAFMASMRTGSLIRTPCVDINPANWNTLLGQMDLVVAAAEKYGHRLILMLAAWGTSYNQAFTVNQSWFTGQLYLDSVYGAGSYQDWVNVVVSRYATTPTVSIYDVCNEPNDSGAVYTSSLNTFAATVVGWIKAIAPSALVYCGSLVTTKAAYETVYANFDLVSQHEYGSFTFPQIAYAGGGYVNGYYAAVDLGKPLIFDEYGTWASSDYSLGDIAPSGPGVPRVSFAGRSAIFAEFLANVMNMDVTIAALAWDYQPSAWNTGGGAGWSVYDQDAARDVIYNTPLICKPFNFDTVSNLLGWLDAAGNSWYAPGTVIGGPFASPATITGVTYSGTTVTITATNTFANGQVIGISGVVASGSLAYLLNKQSFVVSSASGSAFNVTATTTPTGTYTSSGTAITAQNVVADRWNGSDNTAYRNTTAAKSPAFQRGIVGNWPSLQFSGGQFVNTGWSLGNTYQQHSIFAVIYPTSLPGSGYAYLVCPSAAVLGFALALDSSGNLNIIGFGSVPVVIATGTVPLAVNNLYVIQAAWDAANQNYTITVNGNVAGFGLAAAAQTLVTSTANVGAAVAGATGFTGHVLEMLHYGSYLGGTNTPDDSANGATVLSYLMGKYAGAISLETASSA